MSAVVCGSKRSYIEDLSSPTSPPFSKRLRCSSTLPVRFSVHGLLDQLRGVFPHMDSQILERALDECGNDLDAAIKRLHELCLGSIEANYLERVDANVEEDTLTNNGDSAASENMSPPNSLPVDGAGWLELLMREIMGSTSLDDARIRASRVLEALEKSIGFRAGAEAKINTEKENHTFKKQIQALMRENHILKRAVAVQHERQKEFEERNQESQYLKQLVSRLQEELTAREMEKYGLLTQLKHAQQSSSIPGRFNPDVF